MALVLKRMYQGYFYLMTDVADPRADDCFLMSSPFPTTAILVLWLLFIYKWGPAYMKNREPLNLKYIMMVYNVIQVVLNVYIVSWAVQARSKIDWTCAEIDYTKNYWSMKFFGLGYLYYMLKVADLLDTVFFVLRKKTRHVSFLHVYHHFGMTYLGWIGVKFVGGGHSYFIPFANCFVHAILYSYYLLTAYDSNYSKLLWLKKFITQVQLIQFAFLLVMFGQVLFRPGCTYPKAIVFFLVPQNLFMVLLFGDFYIRSYHLEPRKKRKELEEKRKMQELQKRNGNAHPESKGNAHQERSNGDAYQERNDNGYQKKKINR